MITKEKRKFTTHPSIILTLMKEQNGSLNRALMELVMNSIDAGSTQIDINLSMEGFSVKDNGKGFSDRSQIEDFFETFGTPHQEGDAYYAKFRVGRGQVMSYAKTVWRSGNFEMHVDVFGQNEIGYELITHEEFYNGCLIEGEFYEPEKHNYELKHLIDGDALNSYVDSLDALIAYVPVPVILNGKQINQIPLDSQWDFEDQFAWYKFDKSMSSMAFYNRGVLAEKINASEFGSGGVIVSKEPLMVNLARNNIKRSDCNTFKKIKKVIDDRFSLRLSKAKKLTPIEAVRLLDYLLGDANSISHVQLEVIRGIRFIPNIFGELESLETFFNAYNFTVYDGRHTMIAEAVQRTKKAKVITPDLLRLAGVYNWEHKEKYTERIRFMIMRLIWASGRGRGDATLIDFEHFVEELSDTSKLLDDEDLPKKVFDAISILRELNATIGYRLFLNRGSRRELVVGKSETNQAWTDGITFIAININVLKTIGCEGSFNRLIALIVHEYCHEDSTSATHGHTYDFYHKYHNLTMSSAYGDMVDRLFRRHVKNLVKSQDTPSSSVRTHVENIAGFSAKLKAKRAYVSYQEQES